MQKGSWFIFVGIILFLVSIALFVTFKETTVPNCLNRCNDFTSYTDAFTPQILWRACQQNCLTNQENISVTTYNPIYVLFVWLGMLSILIGIILISMRAIRA